jgi:hypothetical protein
LVIHFIMSQTIVKFNIGGTRYEVSQSLLQSYPNTMLAKCAKEQWHKDPNEEIFIERDGEVFRHVLSYLRDGKVSLPPTVTKDSLISDLQYYGVENIQEDKMDDYLVNGYTFGNSFECAQKIVHLWDDTARKYEKRASVLRDCMQLYFVFIRYQSGLLCTQVYPDWKLWKWSSVEECNVYLNQVGISITNEIKVGQPVHLKIHDE